MKHGERVTRKRCNSLSEFGVSDKFGLRGRNLRVEAKRTKGSEKRGHETGASKAKKGNAYLR